MTEVIFICLIRLETHIFALRFLHDLVLSSNMEALSWKASNKKFDSYNTFLLSLFQSSDSEEEGQQQLGFIFSDNKFGSDPTLPFGALALPAFDLVQDSHHYVDVRENHFRCDCDRVSEEKKFFFGRQFIIPGLSSSSADRLADRRRSSRFRQGGCGR